MKSTIFLSICIVVSFFLASNADPFPKFLQGDWDAFALLIEAPLAQAQALLAPGLELKPQNFTAKGTHPLLLLLSNQTDVRTTPPIIDIPQYYEFILVVPWLVRTGDASQKIYGTSIVLYLDDVLAIVGGNIGWSIPKVYERVSWQDGVFEIKRLFSGNIIMNFTYQQLSDDFKPYRAYPNLDVFQQLMSSELIQPFELVSGKFECFTYNFQMKQATFVPVSGVLNVVQEYVENVPLGQFKFQPITSSPLGAFRMKTHWFLSAPFNFC
jgi:hypothetical protein